MQFSLLNNISNPVTYPLPTYPTGLTPSYCPPLNNTCHVQYTITSTWTTGYTVDLVLQNTGLYPLSSWTLDFDLPAQDTVTSYWEADVTQEGQGVVATNTSSNGALAVGQTVDFGFNAGSEDGLGATIPSVFMIGAVACSVN
jgi:cellulase/cellobiase CelA1